MSPPPNIYMCVHVLVAGVCVTCNRKQGTCVEPVPVGTSITHMSRSILFSFPPVINLVMVRYFITTALECFRVCLNVLIEKVYNPTTCWWYPKCACSGTELSECSWLREKKKNSQMLWHSSQQTVQTWTWCADFYIYYSKLSLTEQLQWNLKLCNLFQMPKNHLKPTKLNCDL